jgi:hypothetical protein
MNGEWKENGIHTHIFVTKRRRHAQVHLSDYGPAGRPWSVYTDHTKGNDYFATVEEAKAHAEYRLQRLLDETEDLRSAPID